MKITITTILLFFSLSMFAQVIIDPPNPKVKVDPEMNYPLFIPFNDNGTWGWADTLGNILIEPRYQSAWFFVTATFGKNNVHFSPIETAAGRNVFLAEKGLAVPESYNMLNHHLGIVETKDETQKFYYIIQDSLKKIGVYEAANQELVVKPVYDTLNRYALMEDVVLLKQNKDLHYDHFTSADAKIQTSKIIQVDNIEIKDDSKGSTMCCSTVVKFADGSLKELYNGKLKPFEKFDSLTYKNTAFGHVAMDDERPRSYRKKTAEEKPDKLLRTFSYEQYGELSKKYGFTNLHLWRNGNKLGVVNESDEVILPFIYDDIVFTENNTQAQLYKDGKQGRKIFFTHHPTIAAKYDHLEFIKNLRVKPGWGFGVFRIKKGDQMGFVGENGVEFFRLD